MICTIKKTNDDKIEDKLKSEIYILCDKIMVSTLCSYTFTYSDDGIVNVQYGLTYKGIRLQFSEKDNLHEYISKLSLQEIIVFANTFSSIYDPSNINQYILQILTDKIYNIEEKLDIASKNSMIVHDIINIVNDKINQ